MKELIGSAKDKDIFLEGIKEVEIMKVLNHRNIVGFIDSFIDNQNFYIVMPIAGIPSNLII